MLRYRMHTEILAAGHVLVAGATGSGKSVMLNGLIANAMVSGPTAWTMVDLKRVELSAWGKLPGVSVATEPRAALKALDDTMRLIDRRYRRAKRRGERVSSETPHYLVIDELADLLLSDRSAAGKIQRIAQVARAANVKVVAATQHIPTVPTGIRANFDSKVALHTATEQDSRNIIGIPDAHRLPRYGRCIWMGGIWEVPMYSDAELEEIVNAKRARM